MFDHFEVISWHLSCNKTQINKCSVGSVPNSFRSCCCYLLWIGNIFSFLEKLGMYKRHPHGHGVIQISREWKSARRTSGNEESPNSSLSCAKMDFSSLHSVGNTSLAIQSLPISGSPSCSWWIKEVQEVLPIPWWPWQVVSLEDPQAGMVLQLKPQGSSFSTEPASGQAFSHHFTRSSQPSGSNFPN